MRGCLFLLGIIEPLVRPLYLYSCCVLPIRFDRT
jgi:hypothetical protein